jgi:DNA-binding XRE family transcriptional regulator
MKNQINLSALRKRAKLTQAELAKAIGAHTQQISLWENGVVCVPPKYLKPLAKALRVTQLEMRNFIIDQQTGRILRKQ